MKPDLSVVIPTLDEAQALPVLLDQLRAQDGITLEVIVADGGSTDDTLALAEHAGARVVRAPRGRGAQMNAGAAVAQADTLLFLHADSQLKNRTLLREALAVFGVTCAGTSRADASSASGAGPTADPGGAARVAGHFALRFDRPAGKRNLFYRYLEAKTALGRPGTINGDQGLLITGEYFRELGGFDERLPFLEDQRIAAKIFQTGRWIHLPGRLMTSARRFETEGARRRYTLMALIMGMHAADAQAFFAQPASVYAAHSASGRLKLGPALALAWRVLIDAGLIGALRILYRAGRYTRQNSWQPFFWLDVARRAPLRPALRFHDRFVHPMIDNIAADVIVAIFMSLWFLVVLPLAARAIDRR